MRFISIFLWGIWDCKAVEWKQSAANTKTRQGHHVHNTSSRALQSDPFYLHQELLSTVEVGRWCCPRAGYWTACISSGPRTSHPSCLDAYNATIAISVDGAWSTHSLLYPTQVLNSKPLPFYENYINHFLRGEEKKKLEKPETLLCAEMITSTGHHRKNQQCKSLPFELQEGFYLLVWMRH